MLCSPKTRFSANFCRPETKQLRKGPQPSEIIYTTPVVIANKETLAPSMMPRRRPEGRHAAAPVVQHAMLPLLRPAARAARRAAVPHAARRPHDACRMGPVLEHGAGLAGWLAWGRAGMGPPAGRAAGGARDHAGAGGLGRLAGVAPGVALHMCHRMQCRRPPWARLSSGGAPRREAWRCARRRSRGAARVTMRPGE